MKSIVIFHIVKVIVLIVSLAMTIFMIEDGIFNATKINKLNLSNAINKSNIIKSMSIFDIKLIIPTIILWCLFYNLNQL